MFGIAGDRLAELHVRPIGRLSDAALLCRFARQTSVPQIPLFSTWRILEFGDSRGPPELANIAALCMNRCGHCHCANEVYPFDDLPTQINL